MGRRVDGRGDFLNGWSCLGGLECKCDVVQGILIESSFGLGVGLYCKGKFCRFDSCGIRDCRLIKAVGYFVRH